MARATESPRPGEALWLALLAAPAVGACCGGASALFLALLDRATATQRAQPWLIHLLPLAGLATAWAYRRLGGAADQGMRLVLAQLRGGEARVPRRMAPLVLAGTLVSHVFGASVGREGTAVQMGAGLAATASRLGGLPARFPTATLLAGVAGGFGSVFGTPLAGAVFAVEVAGLGRSSWRWLPLALAAAWTAHLTCLALGARHASHAIAASVSIADLGLLASVALAGAAFGLAARLYVGLAGGMGEALRRLAPSPLARAAIGGAALVGLVHAVGGWHYLGLGAVAEDPQAVTLASAFGPGGATAWSWWWKLLFTALCVAAGYKGGEVTPLLFVGATLGHALAGPLGAPVDLLAGLGLVTVFATAARVPLAGIAMGLELFGPALVAPLALACLAARATAGRAGLYTDRAEA